MCSSSSYTVSIHVYVCTYMYMYMYKCIYMYIHIHVHVLHYPPPLTHACTHSSTSVWGPSSSTGVCGYSTVQGSQTSTQGQLSTLMFDESETYVYVHTCTYTYICCGFVVYMYIHVYYVSQVSSVTVHVCNVRVYICFLGVNTFICRTHFNMLM